MAVPPSKDEALKILQTSLEQDRFLQADEFRQRLKQRQYTIHDVYRVLNVGRIEKALKWREDHGNFEVRVLGRTADGRLTRVVLAISKNKKYVLLVTVIDLTK